MQIEAKKLIGLPVAAIDSGSKIGQISKIIIDQENGTLLGLLVKPNGVFSTQLVLSSIDISDWDPNGIVTNSVDNLVPMQEIIRIDKIIKSNFDLFGLSAKTESKKSLGKIDNFLIDTETCTVTKYYLKDIISGERILPSDKVIKISHNNIIFSDDVESVPPDAAGVVA